MDIWKTITDNAFPLMLIVSSVQFAFTVAITIILHQFSKRQVMVDVLRSIDSQWQDLNKMIIANPQIQLAMDDQGLNPANEEEAIRMNIAYYILNTCQQIIRAKKHGFIPGGTAEDLLRGHFNFLRQFSQETRRILEHDRGFDQELGGMLRVRLDHEE